MTYEELKAIIGGSDINAAVNELRKGRDTTEPTTENIDAELDPLKHKVMLECYRPNKRVKRDADEVGNKETNITGEKQTKIKEVQVCRIPLGIQRLIVNRAVAFAFGRPVKVLTDATDDKAVADMMFAIRAVMRDCKTGSGDRRMARELFSSTEVAELWYLEESNTKIYGFDSKFRIRTALFSPLKGDKLYPYFDERGDLIAFSRQYVSREGEKKTTFMESWTADDYTLYKENGNWEVVKRVRNPIGKIPVVYANQPETEWAKVQPLIERLETLLSNFGDTNDYHASPKLFITGRILGFAKKGEAGAVIEGEQGSDARYISWAQAPESVRLEIETLLRMIYTLTQTPDISFDSVRGLNISGISLRLLFMDAHLKTLDKAEIFDEYMLRRFSIIKSFLKQMNISDKAFSDACDNTMVYAEMQPYMIDDKASNISMLLAANGQKPVMSQRSSIEAAGITNDPDAELEQIRKEEATDALSELLRQQEPTMM